MVEMTIRVVKEREEVIVIQLVMVKELAVGKPHQSGEGLAVNSILAKAQDEPDKKLAAMQELAEIQEQEPAAAMALAMPAVTQVTATAQAQAVKMRFAESGPAKTMVRLGLQPRIEPVIHLIA